MGVLTGGRLPAEDAYAYGKFARAVLRTNDIDFRARAHSAEEAEFLAAHVVARPGVTYDQLEHANAVVLVGFEPEEESPIVFLRLRKAVRSHGTRVYAVASHTSRGLYKLSGTVLRAQPGSEAHVVEAIARDGEVAIDGGGVVLVGERAATSPGLLSAVATLAESTGARIGWVPRRAGERGALEAGLLPNLLPGGRPLSDAAARVDLAATWGVDVVSSTPGRDGNAIVAAAAAGELKALVVAGIDLSDLSDPAAAVLALETVPFVVSLEVRRSEVTERADVILPVAATAERAGTFVNWEGRLRPFDKVLETSALNDIRVLAGIAEELDAALGFRTVQEARLEMQELGPWDGDPSTLTATAVQPSARAGAGEMVLSTWRMLIDDSRAVAGEPYLQATGRAPVAVVSEAALARLGIAAGGLVTVSTPSGSVTLGTVVADVADDVVWLPSRGPAGTGGFNLQRDLRAQPGSVVRVTRGVI
ncbi:MAG: molybdopterin-dependent oxidoreductase [Nocardioidaceae bacterium]